MTNEGDVSRILGGSLTRYLLHNVTKRYILKTAEILITDNILESILLSLADHGYLFKYVTALSKAHIPSERKNLRCASTQIYHQPLL